MIHRFHRRHLCNTDVTDLMHLNELALIAECY